MEKSNQKKPFYKNKVVITLFIMLTITLIFDLHFSILLVSGESMMPTYKNNEFLFGTKINKTYNRFDVIVVYAKDKYIIKRIIGLPGEHIEYKDNKLYINGNLVKDDFNFGTTNNFDVTIDKNSYFCLGDNRNNSLDSRYYGTFNKKYILAKIKQ